MRVYSSGNTGKGLRPLEPHARVDCSKPSGRVRALVLELGVLDGWVRDLLLAAGGARADQLCWLPVGVCMSCAGIFVLTVM